MAVEDGGGAGGPDANPDAALLQRLKAVGMAFPQETLSASRASGLNLALAASMLMQESSGGLNLWGHDPANFAGGFDVSTGKHWGATVTEAGYEAYKAQRSRGGQQGVGSGQLTSSSLQDAADKLGGCWVPLHNMTVAFDFLARLVHQMGLDAGVAAYNGSGPAARSYAQTVISRATVFAGRLEVAAP